jgi:hypothetical protein
MNYLFLFFCSVILPIFSLKVIKPKLCINCKYFVKDTKNNNANDNYANDNYVSDNNIYAKCSFFPKKENTINFLVTGNNMNEYYYCSTSRSSEHMCGEAGKMYKKKRHLK